MDSKQLEVLAEKVLAELTKVAPHRRTLKKLKQLTGAEWHRDLIWALDRLYKQGKIDRRGVAVISASEG